MGNFHDPLSWVSVQHQVWLVWLVCLFFGQIPFCITTSFKFSVFNFAGDQGAVAALAATVVPGGTVLGVKIAVFLLCKKLKGRIFGT